MTTSLRIALVLTFVFFGTAIGYQPDGNSDCIPPVLRNEPPLALDANEDNLTSHSPHLVLSESTRLAKLIVEEVVRRLPTLTEEMQLVATVHGLARLTEVLQSRYGGALSSYVFSSRLMFLQMPARLEEELKESHDLSLDTVWWNGKVPGENILLHIWQDHDDKFEEWRGEQRPSMLRIAVGRSTKPPVDTSVSPSLQPSVSQEAPVKAARRRFRFWPF